MLGCERKVRYEDDAKVFSQATGRMEVPLSEAEETWKKLRRTC